MYSKNRVGRWEKECSLNYWPSVSKNGILSLNNKDSRIFIFIKSNLYAYFSTEALCIFKDNFWRTLELIITIIVMWSTSLTAWFGSIQLYTAKWKLHTGRTYIRVECTFLEAAESTIRRYNYLLYQKWVLVFLRK